MSIARWQCVAKWYFDGQVPDWLAADECEAFTAREAAARYAEQHDDDGLVAEGATMLVHVRPYGAAAPVEVFEVVAETQLVYSASIWRPFEGVA